MKDDVTLFHIEGAFGIMYQVYGVDQNGLALVRYKPTTNEDTLRWLGEEYNKRYAKDLRDNGGR